MLEGILMFCKSREGRQCKCWAQHSCLADRGDKRQSVFLAENQDKAGCQLLCSSLGTPTILSQVLLMGPILRRYLGPWEDKLQLSWVVCIL